ncbi:hypothetical protein SDC9_106490 [bioreactor metagenome]|uniref:Uncharacterized protein n=1 Tax=bioreactor metagenome TaxID=1076179 RepID=A0A645BD63_9ZZZZ
MRQKYEFGVVEHILYKLDVHNAHVKRSFNKLTRRAQKLRGDFNQPVSWQARVAFAVGKLQYIAQPCAEPLRRIMLKPGAKRDLIGGFKTDILHVCDQPVRVCAKHFHAGVAVELIKLERLVRRDAVRLKG